MGVNKRMYKFSYEPSLLRLRSEILLSPLTSLSMMLILLAASILLIHPFLLNAHIIWFVRWCTVLLRHIMEFFYIGPRVAKWASLCLSRREGHRPPRLHHRILLYWPSCGQIGVTLLISTWGVSRSRFFKACCPWQAKPFMSFHVLVFCFCISREYDISKKSWTWNASEYTIGGYD